jgi:hypothetical protein
MDTISQAWHQRPRTFRTPGEYIYQYWCPTDFDRTQHTQCLRPPCVIPTRMPTLAPVLSPSSGSALTFAPFRHLPPHTALPHFSQLDVATYLRWGCLATLTHPFFSLEASGHADSKTASTRRQKSALIGLCVQGIARGSGGPGQWEV